MKQKPHPISAFNSLREQVSPNIVSVTKLDLEESDGFLALQDLQRVLSKLGVYVYSSEQKHNTYYFSRQKLTPKQLQDLLQKESQQDV